MDLSALGFKLLNPTINGLLRSPLHFIASRRLMIIEYSGVKSGKKYSVPVSYFVKDNKVYCFTDGKWWFNFKTQREAKLILKGKNKPAVAKAITDNTQLFISVMTSLIEKFPNDARYYGIRLDRDKRPLPGELERAANNNIMVEFSPH